MGEKQKIGWIGVGKMGNPMSRNLIKAGYSLAVFDIDPAAMNALAQEGAKGATSAAEVASEADVIISMIPDDRALEDVSMEALRRIFEVNLFSLIRVTQACLPGMRRRRKGTVVNLSTIVGKFTFPGSGIYAVPGVHIVLDLIGEKSDLQSLFFC